MCVCILLANGNRTEATQALQLLEPTASGNAEAIILSAKIYVARGDFAAAEEVLRTFLDKHVPPDEHGDFSDSTAGAAPTHRLSSREQSIVETELAWVQLERGETEKVLEMVRSAISLDPNYTWPLELKAEALLRLGQYEQAKDAIGTAIRLDPNNARQWGVLSNIELNAGQLETALVAIEKAINMEPNNEWFRHLHTTILTERKKPDGAFRRTLGGRDRSIWRRSGDRSGRLCFAFRSCIAQREAISLTVGQSGRFGLKDGIHSDVERRSEPPRHPEFSLFVVDLPQ